MTKVRPPRFSLDLLRHFEAAARHMNFTRAAGELFLTQSAISRSIKTLERQLGRQLFLRVDRGLALTDAGRALQQSVGEALGLIGKATGRLNEPGARQGLSVTTNVATASLWLTPRLARFTRSHRDVDLRILATDALVNLDRARVDVAIRHFPPESRPADIEALFAERVFPVCAPALLRRRRLSSTGHLARHVLVQFETYTALGPWLDWTRWLDANGLGTLVPAGVMRFSQYDHAIQAAVDGNGVALGRYPLISEHLREGRLVAPLGTEGVAAGSLHVFTARESAGSAAVASLVRWLKLESRRSGGASDAAPRIARKRVAGG